MKYKRAVLVLVLIFSLGLFSENAVALCAGSTNGSCCSGAPDAWYTSHTCYAKISPVTQGISNASVNYCTATYSYGYGQSLHNCPKYIDYFSYPVQLQINVSGEIIVNSSCGSTSCGLSDISKKIINETSCNEGLVSMQFVTNNFVKEYPLFNLDYDADQTFCTPSCLGGLYVEWGGNACCGDDDNDCGQGMSVGVCDMLGANSGEPEVIPFVPGNVKYAACSEKNYVRLDTGYLSDDPCWDGIVSGGSHDFICDNSSVPAIIQCCGPSEGSGSCILGSSSSVRLTSGDEHSFNNSVIFCKLDGSFSTDLDDDPEACDAAGDDFTWTGDACCSEPADINEYYNDPYSETENTSSVSEFGGCWNNTFIEKGRRIPGRSAVNYNGTFYWCGPPNSTFFDIDDGLSDQKLLTASQPYCTIFKDARINTNPPHTYCKYDNEWGYTDADTLLSKNIGWTNASQQQTECCEQSQCWDGSICIDDQTAKPWEEPTNGVRCLNGQWASAPKKFSWDHTFEGFCPSASQCLVNPNGKFEENSRPEQYFNNSAFPPQCIDDQQYILDYYCENGNWTTRTKKIAEVMLNFVAKEGLSNNYELYCDTYDKSLNVYEPWLQQIKDCKIGDKIKQPCVNNFCVLKYGSNTGFGVSLNEDIDVDNSFLLALGQSSDDCLFASLETDGKYHSCEDPTIWYDSSTNSLIYLPDGSSPQPSLSDFFRMAVKNPYAAVKAYVLSLGAGSYDFNFFSTGDPVFNKIYASRKGSQELFAFLEEGRVARPNQAQPTIRDHIGVKYKGVSIDACNLMRKIDSSIGCPNVITDEVFISRARDPKTIDPASPTLVDVWQDLTSKLRPK